MLTKLRIDVETATREELVAEVLRLKAVTERWSNSWGDIVSANARAWEEQIREKDARITLLEQIFGSGEMAQRFRNWIEEIERSSRSV